MPLIKPAEEIVKSKMQEEKGNPIMYKGGVSYRSTKRKTDEKGNDGRENDKPFKETYDGASEPKVLDEGISEEEKKKIANSMYTPKKYLGRNGGFEVTEEEKKNWEEEQNKKKGEKNNFYYKKVGEGKVQKMQK